MNTQPAQAHSDAPHSTTEHLDQMRIVAWSQARRRWCLCNGFAQILADFATQAEAEAHRTKPTAAHQLPLL